MAEQVDPQVTVFVRFELIGDKTNSSEIAARWKIAPASVTNIRKGKMGVGGSTLAKIAEAEFGGSIDALRKAASEFAAKNPHLLDEVTPVLERAAGIVAMESPEAAATLRAALVRARNRLVHAHDPLALDEALATLRAAIGEQPPPSIAKRDRAWLELALPLVGITRDAANDVAWSMKLRHAQQEPAELFDEAVRVARLNQEERAGRIPPAAPEEPPTPPPRPRSGGKTR